LTILVAKRRRLLNYLQKSDLEGYRALIKRLELRR
jgi:small subunit ribosomal protein S15